MASVASILADPAERSLVRAYWLSADAPSLATAEALAGLAVGPPVAPMELSYVGPDDSPRFHVWTFLLTYPPDASMVAALALVSGAGEQLAGGGSPDQWTTRMFGGLAEITLTCQESSG